MYLPKEYFRYLKEEKKRSPSTLYAYEKDLLQFCASLCRSNMHSSHIDINHQLLTVNPQTADDYREELVRRGFCPSSVSRKLTMLRCFYAWLIQIGQLDTNPFLSTVHRKSPLPPFPYIESEAIQLLFETIHTDTWLGVRDRAMLGLLFNTGMRVSELLCTQVEDIHWEDAGIYVHGGDRPSRYCILWGWVLDELYHYYQLRQQTEWACVKQFFVNRNGGPLTSRSIRRKFSAYGRQAGLDVPITPATLRHSYAMLMLQNGVRPATVKKQLGHLASSSMLPYLDCLEQTHSSCCAETSL